MTAPAVVAPVSAPAPSAAAETPVFPSETFGDKLSGIIRNAPIPQTDPNAQPSIPAGGVSGPTTGSTPVEVAPPAKGDTPEAKAAIAAEVAAVPTGEVSVDDGEITLAAERNADGTFKTQIDPAQKFDIKIRDKETGETKTYSKTIPEVLRMAADGVWGQKVRGEVAYYRENVPQWQKTHESMTTTTAQLRADLDAQMALNRELLTAPDDLVIQRREEFAQEMSPEKQLARLQAENKARDDAAKQTAEQTRIQAEVTSFAQNRLAPHLDAATAKIGPELVKMKLALDILPFQVNGQVPPERLPALEAHMRGPFTDWVNEQAAKLTAKNPAVVAAEEAARRTAAAAQAAVNATGRTIMPVGSPNGASAAAPQAPPKNVNDAIERIVNRPLVGQGRT